MSTLQVDFFGTVVVAGNLLRFGNIPAAQWLSNNPAAVVVAVDVVAIAIKVGQR